MRRVLFTSALSLSLLAAGCQPPALSTNTAKKTPAKTQASVTGLALLTQARNIGGASTVVIEPITRRRFSLTLPPTFTDGLGKYTTPVQGESASVDLALRGTPLEDERTFTADMRIERAESGVFSGWRVTVAFDKTAQRWVARATREDPSFKEPAYTAIECLSAPDSQPSFWNSCRTLIEGASTHGTDPPSANL